MLNQSVARAKLRDGSGMRLSLSETRRLLSLRSKVGGTLEYHIAAAGLKVGPGSVADLFTWPAHLVKDYLDMPGGRARLLRVASLLERGLVVHTDCSGRGTPESTLLLLDVALREVGFALPAEWLGFWRACDSSKLCQDVLLASAHKPVHMFTSLLKMLPYDTQNEIKKLRPSAGADYDTKVAAYRSMNTYLRQNAHRLYGREQRAHNCVLHDAHSGCFPSWREPEGVSARHRPLTSNFSGPPCVPWAQNGSRDGLAHTQMESWLLWRNMNFNLDFDMIILENSDHFPIDLIRDELPPEYILKFVVFGSQDFVKYLVSGAFGWAVF